MKYEYPIVLQPDGKNSFNVIVPDVVGGVTGGLTEEDAILIAKNMIHLMLTHAPKQCNLPTPIEQVKKQYPDCKVINIDIVFSDIYHDEEKRLTKSESKFCNTAQKMHDALIRILEKKELSDISVVEICTEAKVNRSTFYAHYANVYELLEEAYNEKLGLFFKAYKENRDISERDDEDLIFISHEYLLPYLEFIKSNRRFFKVYMERLRSFNIDNIYKVLLERVFVPICKKMGLTDDKAINYLAKFYLQGINSVVLEWVADDCKDDTQFISDVIIRCVRPYLHYEQ